MTCKSNWGATPYTIHLDTGKTRDVTLKRRDLWEIECRIDARERGCTPIDTPGPRWSAYVHSLRALGG